MKIRLVGFSVLSVVILVAGGLALFALELPRVSDSAMAPTLRKGDLVISCRVCGLPKRGDVVLFAAPDAPKKLILRRVIAMPGDEIELKQGRLWVNGAPLAVENEASQDFNAIDTDQRTPLPFAVGEESAGTHRYRVMRHAGVPLSGERPREKLDGYFLLADRRTFARDSRDFGPVPRSDVRSIALRVLSAGDKDATRQARIP